MTRKLPAWSSVTVSFRSQVPVPPPETTSPPTSAWACRARSMAADASRVRSARSGTSTTWAS